MAGAHGIGGAVKLKLFGEMSDLLTAKSHFMVGDRELAVRSVRAAMRGAIAEFVGITDRNAAEALRGSLLTIPRAVLPPLSEGEYYHHDLIGLPCTTSDNHPLGVVVAVQNFGAGDILEIACHTPPQPCHIPSQHRSSPEDARQGTYQDVDPQNVHPLRNSETVPENPKSDGARNRSNVATSAMSPTSIKRKKSTKPRHILVPMNRIAVPHWNATEMRINSDFVI